MRLERVQLQLQVSQVPKSHSLQKKVLQWTDWLVQNEDRSFFTGHKTGHETALVWKQTNLICRAGGQDELAVGIEGQAVHLGCVGVYCVTGLGGVVRPSVPAVPERRGYLWVKYQSQILLVHVVSELLTSWASGHQPPIQKVTREEGARKRPPPQQCGQWRWSWHLRSFPPWAQYWCPTDRWSIKVERGYK